MTDDTSSKSAAREPAAERRKPSATGLREFRWYLAGYGSFFGGMGLNQVLFAWLITVYLGLNEAFALAQTLTMLPMLFLVLFGGTLADRSELRAHLIRLQLLSALPPLALAFLVGFDQLSFIAMICSGIAFASIGAFAMPARDSMLTGVALRTGSIPIPRAVGMATTIQFGAQLIGFLAAGLADRIGPFPLLLLLAAANIGAAFCTSRLTAEPVAPQPTGQTPKKEPILQQIFGGFGEVWKSATYRPILISAFMMAVFGMGPTLVLMPLIVVEVYGGSSAELSAMQFFWVSGIMTTAFIQSVMRPVVHQGRVLIISMTGGTIAMGFIHFQPPFLAILGLVYFWGLVGGSRMALTRAIIQETAPPSHRGRILSVLAMAMAGGVPIGTMLSGILERQFGPLNAILFGCFGFAFTCLCMLLFTRMWYIKREAGQA